MTLSDLFSSRIVIDGDVRPQRDDVIRQLLEALVAAGRIEASAGPAVFRTIIQRESLGSTAIGRSIALPHGRHAAVANYIGAIAVIPAGVDFDSLDGEPVYVVSLCVAPPPPPFMHLGRMMLPVFETLHRCLRHVRFVESLRDARTPVAIALILEAADRGDFDAG